MLGNVSSNMKRRSKRPSPILTPELVREWLAYDPEKGLFTWKKQHYWWTPVGSSAEADGPYGYTVVMLFGKRYPTHRLVWFYVHGSWPKEFIDHINRVRNDNRIANLREATHAQNMANMVRKQKFGMRGVRHDKGLWRAQVMHDRMNYHLGSYETQEQAYGAYKIGARFFKGEFANFETGPPIPVPPKTGGIRKYLRVRTDPLVGAKDQPPELRQLLLEYAKSIEDTEMRALDELSRGPKIHLHTQLYEREMAILDKLAVDNDASRGSVIEALIKAYAAQELQGVSFAEKASGRRRTRKE